MRTKNFNFLFMSVFALMSSTALFSCSSDDDNGNYDGPKDEYGVLTEGKKLRSINDDVVFYDENNRVTEFSPYSFSWRNGKVIMKKVSDYPTGTSKCTLSIANGLIREIAYNNSFETGTLTFTYNGNNRLVKSVYKDNWCADEHVQEYVWEGDRIKKITYINCENEIGWAASFEYNNKICQGGYLPPTKECPLWDFSTDGVVDNWGLIAYAHPELLGIKMNNLPSKVIVEDNYYENYKQKEFVYEYDYVLNEEGYVVECSETTRKIPWDTSYNITNTNTYTWQ